MHKTDPSISTMNENDDKKEVPPSEVGKETASLEAAGAATTDKKLSSSKSADLETNQINEKSTSDGQKKVEAGEIDEDEIDPNQGDEVKKGKGRRGDPRMHRAVAARLAKPQLSLFQALVAGGFKFPVNELASKGHGPIYDSDNVLLSQRKNQLSRRLRLLARRRHSHQMALNASGAPNGMTLEKSNNIVSAIEANNKMLFAYPQMQFPPGTAGLYPGMNIQQQIQMQTLIQQQQEMVRSSAAALGLNKLNANPAVLGFPGLATQTPPISMNSNTENNNNDHDNKDNTNNNTATTPSAASSTSNPQDIYKLRLGQAIQFYKHEKEALKKRALIAAGFNENEIEAVNEEYQQKLLEVDGPTSKTQEEANDNGVAKTSSAVSAKSI